MDCCPKVMRELILIPHVHPLPNKNSLDFFKLEVNLVHPIPDPFNRFPSIRQYVHKFLLESAMPEGVIWLKIS
jgi:hypothetical protein